MEITKQELQAYVDGELAPVERARVEAAIAADPAVARRAEAERALRARLRDVFDPVLAEPLPSRLQALLADRAHAPPGRADVASARSSRRRGWQVPAYALAASLLAFAVALWPRQGSVPVRLDDHGLVAIGPLEDALDHGLASTPDPAGPVAIGLSFRTRDGRICRSFVQDRSLQGLACRRGARWEIELLSTDGAHSGDGVRQAGSAIAPDVQAAIDARIQGEAFDAAQERAARAAHWR